MAENESLEPIKTCPDCGKNAVLAFNSHAVGETDDITSFSYPTRLWLCKCGWWAMLKRESEFISDPGKSQEGDAKWMKQARELDEKFFQWCWNKANEGD